MNVGGILSKDLVIVGNAQQDDSFEIGTIESAINRNIFNPFYESLNRNSDSWGDGCWFKRIQKCTRPNPTGKINKDLLPSFLFSVAVDPDVCDEDKKNLMAEGCHTSDKKSYKNFISILGNSDAVITVNILKYCSNDTWLKTFHYIQKYGKYGSSTFEKKIYKWIQEAANSPWPADERQAFIDRIFEIKPKEAGDELLFYYLLQDAHFYHIISGALKKNIGELQFRISKYVKEVFDSLNENAHIIRICSNNTYESHYIIDCFFTNSLDDPNSDLIAAGFSKENWEVLESKFEKKFDKLFLNISNLNSSNKDLDTFNKDKNLIFYIKKWMISIAIRLQTDTLSSQKLGEGAHDPGVWLFYNFCTEYVLKNKKWNDDLSILYYQLALQFTAENLHRYRTAFKDEFLQQMIKVISESLPEKLYEWSIEIFQCSKGYRESVSENMASLFKHIHKNGQFELVIPIFFENCKFHNLSLTIFVTLSRDMQKVVLQRILCDKQTWLIIIEKWIDLCIKSDPKVLEPFVRYQFTKNFYSLLYDIDSSIPIELKKLKSLDCQSSTTRSEFLDILLPIGEDLMDPICRQKLAIKKLKMYFLTPGISHDDRRNFVRELSDDLKRDLSLSQFAEQLFHELPEETWPLVFLHFEYAICYSSYNNYYEEKSQGGSFNKVKNKFIENSPYLAIKMKGAQDENIGKEMVEMIVDNMQINFDNNQHKLGEILLWADIAIMMDLHNNLTNITNRGIKDYVQWVNIASQTLIKMINNPCLSEDEICWAMQPLFQQACNTNTLYPIIIRCIENVEPQKFMLIMTWLRKSCFHHNSDDIKDLIAVCIHHANIDRISFVTTCLKDQTENLENRSLIAMLVKDPILKSDEERAAIAKNLIYDMGIQFITLFKNRGFFINELIKSLKNVDSYFCEKLFIDIVQMLCQVKNSEEFKFVLFQAVCGSFMDSEVDILQILEQEDCQKRMQSISSWCSIEILSEHFCIEPNAINVIMKVRPDNLQPAIIQRLESLLNKKQIFFYEIDVILRNLEKANCLKLITQEFETEKSEIHKLFVDKLDSQFMNAFDRFYEEVSFDLLCKLIPNWKERILNWAKEEMKKDRDSMSIYGKRRDSSELKQVLSKLSENRKFIEWMKWVENSVEVQDRQSLKEYATQFNINWK